MGLLFASFSFKTFISYHFHFIMNSNISELGHSKVPRYTLGMAQWNCSGSPFDGDYSFTSEILNQLSKEPVTDDILNVIHNMQQEEQELANLSCTVFLGWWTRKRRHSISKSLKEALDNE